MSSTPGNPGTATELYREKGSILLNSPAFQSVFTSNAPIRTTTAQTIIMIFFFMPFPFLLTPPERTVYLRWSKRLPKIMPAIPIFSI